MARSSLLYTLWKFVPQSRNFSASQAQNYRVGLIGSYGGIGQSLSLLLKQEPLITNLILYDIKSTCGIAADLSHIPTNTKVLGTSEGAKLDQIMKDVEIVIITAGEPRKPGMSRDDLFEINAGIVADVIKAVACTAPKAMIGLVTNPINSTLPVAAEILNKMGVYDPKRLFGVTSLDVMRARTFLAEEASLDPCAVSIPVVGGHSTETIIPLISQTKPAVKLEEQVIKDITKRIQNAGTEVVEAKKGSGSSTLSMAYAAAAFVHSLCRGLKGDKDVVECAMVESQLPEAKFIANPVELGKNGIEKNLGVGKLNDFEHKLFCDAMKLLAKDIEKGIEFAKKYKIDL